MTTSNARHRLCFFVLAGLALAAASCQYLDGVVPTVSAPAEEDQPTAVPLDESPRLRDLQDQDVPPTWTPPASQHSETPIAPGEAVPETRVGGQASYTVQPGDTLAAIAQRFNVSLEELARVNDIEDFDHIEIGQVLVIPGF